MSYSSLARKKVQSNLRPKETAAERKQPEIHLNFETLKNRDTRFKGKTERKLTKRTRTIKVSREKNSDDDVIEIRASCWSLNHSLRY